MWVEVILLVSSTFLVFQSAPTHSRTLPMPLYCCLARFPNIRGRSLSHCVFSAGHFACVDVLQFFRLTLYPTSSKAEGT